MSVASEKIPSVSEELEGVNENLASLETDAKTMWKMIRNISRFALEITRKTEDSEVEEHATRFDPRKVYFAKIYFQNRK